MRERPRATALGGAVVVLGVLAVVLEVAFDSIEAGKPRPEEVQTGTFTTDFFVDDSLLGYGPAHNYRATSMKTIDGVTAYDVVYTVDGEGRRVTPAPAAPAPDGPILLFFGCSNTFGEGVQDWETLPSCVAALAPRATVYNYGFCGYGPQQVLDMIKNGRLDDVVRDRDVIAIYLFIDAHVARAVGSMVVTTTWGVDMPHYVLDGSNELKRRGSFRTGRSCQNWAYALLSRYRTFTAFGRDLPPLRDSHFALTARILEEAAGELRARARSSSFHVALHPHVRTRDRFLPHFEGSEVRILDYVGLYGANDEEYMIPGDWHPTPLAYRTIGPRSCATWNWPAVNLPPNAEDPRHEEVRRQL